MRVEPGASPPPAADRGRPDRAVARPFTQVLDEVTGTAPPRPLAATSGAGAPRTAPAGPTLAAVVARAADAERAVDTLLAAAARGRTFTPTQLLALQATVSRGAQTVEVLSRAADRLVGTVKQTLGAQI